MHTARGRALTPYIRYARERTHDRWHSAHRSGRRRRCHQRFARARTLPRLCISHSSSSSSSFFLLLPCILHYLAFVRRLLWAATTRPPTVCPTSISRRCRFGCGGGWFEGGVQGVGRAEERRGENDRECDTPSPPAGRAYRRQAPLLSRSIIVTISNDQ